MEAMGTLSFASPWSTNVSVSSRVPYVTSKSPLRVLPSRRRANWVCESPTVDDKAVVTEYFNTTGFDRWSRIYSEDGEVNSVQKDIRVGHDETVQTILKWVDADGSTAGMTVCDAGCGVGSLAIPLARRGAVVFASDISSSMVEEGRRRAQDEGVNVQFEVSDLEKLTGLYDTVTCIDVMIHYPDEKLEDMISHLCSLSSRRLILTFAPKTMFLSLLKKIGDFFPGPSKATRAYLHSEDDVVTILRSKGWTIRRSSLTSTKFYFSRILEATRT